MEKAKRIPILVLRLIALGAAGLAIALMVTSHDSAQVLNITFKAKYTNSPTFKYFVGVNAIGGVYTLLVLFLPYKKMLWRLVLVMDLIIALLLDSGISATLGIAQVGKNGNEHAGWLPICGQVPKFCDRVTGSVIAGFVAALVYFLLVLYSLHSVLNLLTLKNSET